MKNISLSPPLSYTPSLRTYTRRPTLEVGIGELPMGAEHPIRLQSMTTADTMDTEATVAEVISLHACGSEYVRLTVPSLREAENLALIKKKLAQQGCLVPLIADVHFTPNVALVAARIVEKVRINPGNYADKKRFEEVSYDEKSHKEATERISDKLIPLLKVCQTHGTALRIGANHGSLSDRMMGYYGDTPRGMVESVLEYLRICEDWGFFNTVISMKASNPKVMIQAYRLLVHRLDEGGFRPYPLHIGVTEAGDGEDGRIKSALGIGALLEDGLGDTVRVSLTEASEHEIPVARTLVSYAFAHATHDQALPEVQTTAFQPFAYTRRKTHPILHLGQKQVPRVMIPMPHEQHLTARESISLLGYRYLPDLDKWQSEEQACDFVYAEQKPWDALPYGLKQVLDYGCWKEHTHRDHTFPLLKEGETSALDALPNDLPVFLMLHTEALNKALFERLRRRPQTVLVLDTRHPQPYLALRWAFFQLEAAHLTHPVMLSRSYTSPTQEAFLLHASVEIGALFLDGYGDGLMLAWQTPQSSTERILRAKDTAFGILQATRTRISKTDYIACPSCGRTLFDLERITAHIRAHTQHLKGLKIGIMGCIVNGPGEMADADYGYVGSGKGKITLYRGKEVVARAIPSEKAVQRLIDLIKTDGNWQEPPSA